MLKNKVSSVSLSAYVIKLFSIISIVCLGIIVYSNTFFCSFHLDDSTSIVYNSSIKNLHNLQYIWSYLPRRFFLYLSFAINYHFHQLDVFGYHLFNLVVHLCSALLVWWLTLLTLSTPVMKNDKIAPHADSIALFAGLVFVCHPVQTQAVTYIVQRAASLATLFYLAAISLYVKSRLLQNNKLSSSRVKFCYLGALITAVMAMFTKEIAITLPLMIVLFEFSFFQTKKEFRWLPLIPFLLTIFIIPATIFFTEYLNKSALMGIAADGSQGISRVAYLATQLRVMVTYIRLIFLPINQNLDYDYPIFTSFLNAPVLLSFLALIVILFLTKHLFTKFRLISFSIFWFFITLLPESSLMPIRDVIFEHRLYLPLVGFSIFLASGLFYFFEKRNYKIALVILILIIAGYSGLTYQRNKVWKDDLSLWEDIVHKSPQRARAFNGRGLAYVNQGDLDKALSDYNKAIEINPHYAKAYNNRGLLYDKKDEHVLALADYNQAITNNPNFFEAYANRGNCYDKQGDFSHALSDFNKAIEINPNFAEAYNSRGIAFDKQGDSSRALADYQKAMELNPSYGQVYYNLGLSYAKQMNFSQAIAAYSKAIAMDSKYADAYYNRGLSYAKQGLFAQAISEFTQTIKLDPNSVDAYYNRGLGYAQQGDLTQAVRDYTKAIEIDPRCAQAYYSRGNLQKKNNNFAAALADYSKAIEINPRFVEAYYNRGNAFYEQDNFDQAMSDYSKVIEINPKAVAKVYNNRAITYYQLGKYNEAWADIHNAEASGAVVNSQLLEDLKKASGRIQ